LQSFYRAGVSLEKHQSIRIGTSIQQKLLLSTFRCFLPLATCLGYSSGRIFDQVAPRVLFPRLVRSLATSSLFGTTSPYHSCHPTTWSRDSFAAGRSLRVAASFGFTLTLLVTKLSAVVTVEKAGGSGAV
jgi:hypothetical protein